jgi:hypothetical protein
MEILSRYFSQATLVVLFVLVARANGDTNTTSTSTQNSASAASGNSSLQEKKSSGAFLSTLLQNAKAANFIDLLPHPIGSFELVVKEAKVLFKEFTLHLPEFLHHPLPFIIQNVLNIAALVLAVMSFIPTFILPAKVIALLLSIVSLLIGYSAPFDKNYLSAL